MMNGGIILGRAGERLMTCVACGKPTPPDHIAPLSPHKGLCGDCWSQAGNLRNWLRQPSLGNGVPIVDLLILMLAPYGGMGRGDDRNAIRILARVLWERDQMRAEAGTGSVSYVPRCCYCDDREREGEENLVEMTEAPGLPKGWHCREYEACDGRLFHRLMLMVASVVSGQQA
jgi:hypothetical protein